MGYLTWILPFFLAGACCVVHGVWQIDYNVKAKHLIRAEFEDHRGRTSCKWESPPENGFNFRTCSEGLCSDTVGAHKKNGTLRFTRCNSHYLLVEGSDTDTCDNGQWTSSGHQCIPCGMSQTTFNPLEDLPLIYNGHTSSRGDFPWMVALYNRLDGKNWEQICGGTLISPGLVLTAAHCLIISRQNLRAENVRVGVGKLFRSYYQGEISSRISTVQEIIRPERYRGADHLFELDIALLVLRGSVTTGPYVMPACMDWGATMEPKHDEVGYLAGWGVTEQGTPSSMLKWASQKYVQYDNCQTMLTQEDKRIVTQDKFCVAKVKGGKADKGDSGGGLTFLRDGAHYVYGVLSVKVTNDDDNVRLFTNTLNVGHLDWLRQHWRRLLVKEPEKKPPSVTKESEPVIQPPERGAKSKEMCKKYAEYVFLKIPNVFSGFKEWDSCNAVEPLIANGKDATTREYPHMALVGYGELSSSQWYCGGSLISERFVLSAASCSGAPPQELAKWVLLGEYSKQSTADEEKGLSQPKLYEIIERIIHPDYKAPSLYNDIALFRLNKEVEFNEFIRPICLHTEYEIPKTHAIATGWGHKVFEGVPSDILQKVDLTITPNNECRDAYKNPLKRFLKDGVIDESMMCAGDKISGKDTCQGDGGAPLQLRLKDPYCMYSQIGITSFSIHYSCEATVPTVYTRVSYYVPWIESIVWY